jgi:hypothetical protein
VLRRAGGGPPFRLGLLHADEGDVFPDVDLEGWREGVFGLLWRQHGGSGLGVTYAEAMDLPLPERDWLLERIARERTREAKEIEKAGKKKR